MVRIIALRFLESYFRHRWLSLLPLLIALAAGVYFALSAPPSYVATGRLYVEKESLLASLTSTSSDGSWWISPAQATTTEISELVASRAFTRSVIQKTDLEQNLVGGEEAMNAIFSYYREALSSQPRGDKMVEISATSDDPKLAHQMVVATMDAYVQWKLNADYRESVTAQEFFANLLDPYKQEVDKARSELVTYLKRYPEPVRGDRPPDEQLEVERLRAELVRAEERFTTAQNNEENARYSQATSESVTRQTYLVIDQPLLPQEPEGSLKGLLQDLAIFVVVGIMLTLGVIGAGALLDRSLRFTIDVRHGLSLPVLAMIPTGAAKAGTPALVPGTQPEPLTDPSTLRPSSSRT